MKHLYVMLWARSPNYTLLYSELADRDITQVAEALEASDIPYRVDPASGGVLVAASRLHDAKLQLAASGLPRGAGIGFELMQEDGGFGTSQFIERAPGRWPQTPPRRGAACVSPALGTGHFCRPRAECVSSSFCSA